MVPLKDIFSMLATGALVNTAISNAATDSIKETDYGKIINHINLGVISLYTRFKLLENEMALNVSPATTKYSLRLDGYTPANIVEITGVFSEDGTELKINDRFSTPVIRQLSVDSLSVTGLTSDMKLSIAYQAYPAKIELLEDFDINEYDLDIPGVLVEALLYYVAAKVFKPMGANDSTANSDKSASYEQQYELACQKIALYGITPQCSDELDTFLTEGWA